MSRADAGGVAGPRLSQAIRSAAVDFYYHSWRLVPANLAWGIVLLAAVFAGLAWLVGGAIVAVLLALPTVGVYRLAALIMRGEDVVLSDAYRAYRSLARPALVLGICGLAGSILFLVNVVTGVVTFGGPVGWAIATAAGWGLVATWGWLLIVWPLVVDPQRDGAPLRANARLAALMVLAYPLRAGALLAITALVVAVSTVLFAALITISIAFVALVGCHYVLPAADRLEARLAATAPTG